MPDELYELWLEPFFKRDPIPDDFTMNPENFQILMVWQNRLKFSFPELMQRRWIKDRDRFKFTQFHRDSVWKMERLITEWTTAEKTEKTEITNIIDSKERFWASVNYIKREGKIPKPVVFKSDSEGHMILDGHHRIAAFHYLFPNLVMELDFWHSSIEYR